MYGYKDVLSTDIGTVDSGCFYLIFIDVFFAIVLFFFKLFTKAEKDLADEINLKNDEPIKIAIAANETKSDLNEIKEDTENETNVNIRRIAEGHCDLVRNLREARKVDDEKELLAIRVTVLESDMSKVKHQLAIT